MADIPSSKQEQSMEQNDLENITSIFSSFQDHLNADQEKREVMISISSLQIYDWAYINQKWDFNLFLGLN